MFINKLCVFDLQLNLKTQNCFKLLEVRFMSKDKSEIVKYSNSVLDIIRLQLRQGIHISNIAMFEQNLNRVIPLLNDSVAYELKGIISQIKHDINKGNINRDCASKYTTLINSSLDKL